MITDHGLIDWRQAGLDAVWIAGLAIVSAAASYYWWRAASSGRGIGVLDDAGWRMSSRAGACLACGGWGLAHADRWWTQGLWVAAALSLAWDGVRAARRRMPR